MANDRTPAHDTEPVERADEPYEPPTIEALGRVHAKTLQTGIP